MFLPLLAKVLIPPNNGQMAGLEGLVGYNILMKKVTLGALVVTLLPATTHAQGLQEFIPNFVTFLSNIVIPFLLGIAFLLFVINAIRFFVFQSTSEEGRDKAKSLAIYSIAAFVLIIVFWGIINILNSAINLGGGGTPTSDYACPGGMCPGGLPNEYGPSNPCNDPNNPACENGRV